MQKPVPYARTAPSLSLRLIAAVVLICHAMSATAVLPFAVLSLALLDGSHSVVVEYGGQGVGIRLHHRKGDFTPCSCDHRTAAGRAVALLCQPSTEGDHVLAASSVSPNTEIKNRQNETLARALIGVAVNHQTVSQIVSSGSLIQKVASVERSRIPALHCHRCAMASVRLLI